MKRSVQFCGNLFFFLAFCIAWQPLPAQITTLLDPFSQTKFTNPLPIPRVLANRIVIGPGERIDIIVDFFYS